MQKNYELDNCFIRKLTDVYSDFDILDFCELDDKKYPYLLESSAKGNSLSRYSILFYKPRRVIEKKKEETNSPFIEEVDRHFTQNRLNQDMKKANLDLKLPFLGGWFIYLGYELVEEIEEKLKIPESPYKIPTAFLDRVSSAIIFDKVKNELFFISDNSKKDIFEMLKDYEKIKQNRHNPIVEISRKITASKIDSSATHHEGVKECIKYIFSGEIFQANLSRLWEFDLDKKTSNTEIYRKLRISNPSPFGGLVSMPEGTIISSSPERLVQVKDNKLQTRPIAGTRPRGFSGLTDVELSKELIGSKKERAEHLMLVDLERNDISRVCKAGSVKVDEMMVIESYAHVHHIVSNISGTILEDTTPGKIIKAVFPGGTITGCPKHRCIEILGSLEKIGRGPYTGSFGYLCHNGELDLNILIRSMVRTEDKLFIRAGGGIVADSNPQKETLETEAKANGMLRALELVNK